MAFEIQPHETVLFIGDSITDCGRRNEHRPLGAGYVRMAADLIAVRYPDHHLRVINTGIGGNMIRDLYDRWTDDCIRHQPDWLSVKIGINDNHRWLSGAAGSYDSARFEDYYRLILDRARKETTARLILVTPFYMSTATGSEEEGWRGRVTAELPGWIAVVEKMAAEYDARLVNMHKMYQTQFARGRRTDEFGDEPVHPNATGHLMMAHEWLKAVGW